MLDFKRQAAAFVSAYGAAGGDYPNMHCLDGQNRRSPVLAIGSSDDDLGPLVLHSSMP